MPLSPGNDLDLGFLQDGKKSLPFPRTLRDKHLYICGGTGTGKSKFLENLIRQDILASSKSKCGLLLIDPHGAIYDSLMQWLAWNKVERPVIPIDLRQDEWIVAYNILRQRSQADPQVFIDNGTQAIAHVWGASGVQQTPLFARWVGNFMRVLYEKGLTLVQAEHLLDAHGGHLRHLLTSDIKARATRQDWEAANTLNAKDFEAQVGSTINRLLPFLQNERMRTTFGVRDVSLDLGAALEEGHIILVNLATEGAKISEENAKLFSSLLLSDLWTAAKERGKPGDGRHVKPFYVYIDEFQDVVTPTIARNLDQARGFGLHLTLANQFPRQILTSGPQGQQVYDSVMENASSKVVFRLSDEENLLPLAKWLFRGVFNPDEIKHQLYSTKVMGYREETRQVYSESSSTGSSKGRQSGSATGAGLGGTQSFYGDESGAPVVGSSESKSDFASSSQSASEGYSEASAESVSNVPVFIPVFGKELSSVQFRALEEQQHRAMAVLFDQKERHAVVRLAGETLPAAIRTPDVTQPPASPAMRKRYLESRYSKWKFALTGEDARARLTALEAGLSNELIAKSTTEPATAKRRLR